MDLALRNHEFFCLSISDFLKFRKRFVEYVFKDACVVYEFAILVGFLPFLTEFSLVFTEKNLKLVEALRYSLQL